MTTTIIVGTVAILFIMLHQIKLYKEYAAYNYFIVIHEMGVFRHLGKQPSLAASLSYIAYKKDKHANNAHIIVYNIEEDKVRYCSKCGMNHCKLLPRLSFFS